MEDLGHVDAALLCTPTRSVEETALPLLARGINLSLIHILRQMEAIKQKALAAKQEVASVEKSIRDVEAAVETKRAVQAGSP